MKENQDIRITLKKFVKEFSETKTVKSYHLAVINYFGTEFNLSLRLCCGLRINPRLRALYPNETVNVMTSV